MTADDRSKRRQQDQRRYEHLYYLFISVIMLQWLYEEKLWRASNMWGLFMLTRSGHLKLHVPKTLHHQSGKKLQAVQQNQIPARFSFNPRQEYYMDIMLLLLLIYFLFTDSCKMNLMKSMAECFNLKRAVCCRECALLDLKELQVVNKCLLPNGSATLKCLCTFLSPFNTDLSRYYNTICNKSPPLNIKK